MKNIWAQIPIILLLTTSAFGQGIFKFGNVTNLKKDNLVGSETNCPEKLSLTQKENTLIVHPNLSFETKVGKDKSLGETCNYDTSTEIKPGLIVNKIQATCPVPNQNLSYIQEKKFSWNESEINWEITTHNRPIIRCRYIRENP